MQTLQALGLIPRELLLKLKAACQTGCQRVKQNREKQKVESERESVERVLRNSRVIEKDIWKCVFKELLVTIILSTLAMKQPTVGQ